MSDLDGLINERRSANREQQTLPGGLRTPAEKDVLFFFFFCKYLVAYDAVSGKAREKCYLWHWVLGRTAMSRGARQIVKVALQGSHGPVVWLSAEPCECSSLEHAARREERQPRCAPAKVIPSSVLSIQEMGKAGPGIHLWEKCRHKLRGNELHSRVTAAVSQ